MTHDDPHADLVRRQQIQAVGTAFLRRRPLIVAPAAVFLLVLIARAGVPVGQLAALAAIKTALVGFFCFEAWRYRGREIGSRGLFASLALTLLGITLGCAVTGDIRSPLVPLLFAPSILGLAAFGARRAGFLMVALLVLAAAILLALPPLFPPLPARTAAVATFATLVVTALLFAAGITGLVQGYERTGFALGRVRDELAAGAEAQTREMAGLGARLAHELKNPLAALKGLIQLEGQHAGGERSQRRFAVMESEMSRLEQILTDYLSFSRPAADPTPRDVSAQTLLREVLDVLEGRAQAQGVRLETEGEDVALAVDPLLVKQALFNLVSNALEASPAGGAVVARVRRHEGAASLEVRDAGRGMDADVLARLGTPFFSTRAAGTGLGVVIARRVARQHGGELRFESQPGQGTTAFLQLPLARGPR
jgi:signal transduction histidine kinase